VQSSSAPGDLILDPFLGSGTTAIVARDLDRRCIGIEIEKDYVALAKKRLKASGVESAAG
jgi:DNA modification methylase